MGADAPTEDAFIAAKGDGHDGEIEIAADLDFRGGGDRPGRSSLFEWSRLHDTEHGGNGGRLLSGGSEVGLPGL